jgi:hypothetical protein
MLLAPFTSVAAWMLGSGSLLAFGACLWAAIHDLILVKFPSAHPGLAEVSRQRVGASANSGVSLGYSPEPSRLRDTSVRTQ